MADCTDETDTHTHAKRTARNNEPRQLQVGLDGTYGVWCKGGTARNE